MPTIGLISGNSERCPFCRRWVISQGIKNHKRKHVAYNDRMLQRASIHGSVKIRGPLYKPDVSIILDVIDDYDLVEVNDDGSDDPTANVDVNTSAALVSVDDDDMSDTQVPPLEGGYDGIPNATSAGSKRSASHISRTDDDNHVTIYNRQRNALPNEIVSILNDYHSMKSEYSKKAFIKWAQVKHKRPKLQTSSLRTWLKNEKNIRSSAKQGKDSCEKVSTNLTNRQRNVHPNEVVSILNDYHSMKSEYSNKAFIKWAQVKHKRPKLQTKSLRTWLKNEENIRASAKQDKDRRYLSVSREKVCIISYHIALMIMILSSVICIPC